MDLEEHKVRNYCAGVDQQQIKRLTDSSGERRAQDSEVSGGHIRLGGRWSGVAAVRGSETLGSG
jgi:hypothetical protein